MGYKMLRIDCIRDCIRRSVPQPTEWQRIGNQINAAFVASRSDFVKMHEGQLYRVGSRAIFDKSIAFADGPTLACVVVQPGSAQGFARKIAAMRRLKS